MAASVSHGTGLLTRDACCSSPTEGSSAAAQQEQNSVLGCPARPRILSLRTLAGNELDHRSGAGSRPACDHERRAPHSDMVGAPEDTPGARDGAHTGQTAIVRIGPDGSVLLVVGRNDGTILVYSPLGEQLARHMAGSRLRTVLAVPQPDGPDLLVTATHAGLTAWRPVPRRMQRPR